MTLACPSRSYRGGGVPVVSGGIAHELSELLVCPGVRSGVGKTTKIDFSDQSGMGLMVARHYPRRLAQQQCVLILWRVVASSMQ